MCYNRVEKKYRLTKITLALGGLFVTLYSVLWFILANILHDYVSHEIDVLNQQGKNFSCSHLYRSGYPLRIGVTCDGLHWQDQKTGLAATINSLVASAPVYAPSWRSMRVQAPGHFRLVDFGTIKALWQGMVVHARFVDEQVNSFTLTIDNPALSLDGEESPLPVISMVADFVQVQIEELEVQESRWQAGIKISIDALRLPLQFNENGNALPSINGESEIWLDSALASIPPSAETAVVAQGDEPQGELAGRVKKFVLQFSSGGGMEMEGTFSISSMGILSGQFTATLQESHALLRAVHALILPQSRILANKLSGNLESLAFALNAMPKNEQGHPLITIIIDDGFVRAGFIPLGTLPSFKI